MRNISKQMSKILIGLILISAFSFSAKAQSFTTIELENLSNFTKEDYGQLQFNIYANTFKPDAKFGFYYFALVNQYWAQAYAGVVYKPIDWMSISLGAGLETNADPYRFNLSMLMFRPKFNFIQIYEYGGSGFWYNIQFNYKLNSQNNLGVIGERYYGIGINYEHTLKSIPIRFTIAPLFDYESESFKLKLALRYIL